MHPFPRILHFFFLHAAFGVLVMLVCHAPAAGQNSVYVLDSVVISASKIETDAEHATASVCVVTTEDIAERQDSTLADSLTRIPGASVNVQGGAGQLTKFYIRGGDYKYTQIRYDDFLLVDQSSASQELSGFNSALLLNPSSLNRMEVLKGSQGVMYGSSAIGGVINLYPRSNWDAESSVEARTSFGSYETWSASGALTFTGKYGYLTFAPMFYKTRGYLGMGFDQQGATFGTGLRLGESSTIKFLALGMTDDAQSVISPVYDSATGNITPQEADGDNHQTRTLYLTGLTFEHIFSDKWDLRLKTGLSGTNRKYLHDMYGDSQYKGTTFSTELLNTIRPLEGTTFLAGLEYQHAHMEQSGAYMATVKLNEDTWSVFAKAIQMLLNDSLALSLGGRYTSMDNFGGHATFDVGAAYSFNFGLRFYGNVASGFKTPSLYERYGLNQGTPVGNRDLKPEKSISYEIGFEQNLLNKRLTFGGALFYTNYRDRIGARSYYDPYENFTKARARGFELYARALPHYMLGLELAYTHVKSEFSDFSQIWRKTYNHPENQLSATVSVYPVDALAVSLTGHWRGKTLIQVYDNFWMGHDVREPAFFTMDLAAIYNLSNGVSFYSRFNNLLNKHYTVEGHSMPGFNCMLGIQVKF